jgi:hypothetical protein
LATGVGSLRGSIDSALAASARRTRSVARLRARPLSPLGDSIAEKLVFPPVTQSWFIAAARGKRMLIDIGRVDMEVRRDPAKLAEYKRVVEARTPFPAGTHFRLRGPWGSDDATITGFDTWNGRIVAVIETAERVDSLARLIEPLPATAQLVDSTTESSDDECRWRAPLAPAPASRTGSSTAPPSVLPAGFPRTIAARIAFARDSIEKALRAAEKPPYERLEKQVRSRSSFAVGCFDGGPAIVIVTLWAGEYEWVRQQVVLVGDDGRVHPLGVRDYRFRAHEATYAMDGDGDGFDDLATRGYGSRLGGTSVLKLVPGTKPTDPRRLERIATGFGWENR